MKYEVIELDTYEKLEPHQNYGLRNPETGCIEARAEDMPAILAAKWHLEFLMTAKPWENVQSDYDLNEDDEVCLSFDIPEVSEYN